MKIPIRYWWATLVPFGLGLLVGSAQVAGARVWDPTTAAWVQAVGSIGAIVVVFLIDNRASERLRKDRAKEFSERRKEALDATARAEHSRLAAIFYGSEAFANAIQKINQRSTPEAMATIIPSEALRRIRGAEGAINALLAQTGEIVPEILAGLALASQAILHWKEQAEIGNKYYGPGWLEEYLEKLRQGERELMNIYDETRDELQATKRRVFD